MKEKIKKIWAKIKVHLPLIGVVVLVGVFVFGLFFLSRWTEKEDKKLVSASANELEGAYYLELKAGARFIGDTSLIPEVCYLNVGEFPFSFSPYMGNSIDGGYDYLLYPLYIAYTEGGLEIVEDSYIPIFCDFPFDHENIYLLLGDEILYYDTSSASIGVKYVALNGGYDIGYESGYAAGKSDGLLQGREEGYNNALDEVEANKLYYEEQGYDKGYSAGYESGFIDGHSEGWYKGYDVGYDEAKVDLRDEIETEVLNDKETFLEGIFSIFDAPLRVVRDIFNFELFGINIADLVFFVLTAIIVVIVVKKLKGG